MAFSVSLTVLSWGDYALCFLIFGLPAAALCLFVKVILDFSSKRKVGKRTVITELACAVLALGLSWTVFMDMIRLGPSPDLIDTQPMVNLVGYDYNQSHIHI